MVASDTIIVQTIAPSAATPALSAPVATLLAALVAAVSGLGVALYNSHRQRKLDAEQWPRLREDALAADIRKVIQEIATKMATALHSICWLTWLARGKPNAITQARIDAYDAEMHRLLPEMTGALAAVAALDRDAYKRFAPLVHAIEVLDVKVGEASLAISESREAGAKALAACYAEGDSLSGRLPGEIADITSETVARRANRLAAIQRTAS